MLKHTQKNVPALKKTPDRFVPLKNVFALQQLNHGSLWVKIEEEGQEKDVILYGATMGAWTGSKDEKLFIVENGQDREIPASTKILGFYEQRDLPPQYANIWDERKEQARKKKG